MKKTSDFRFWSRFGAGIFCLIAFAAFYIKAAIIKPEVSVARFDTNGSGVPDVIRVFFDDKLHRELIDFSWNDVYTYRIYWNDDIGVKRIERMLDVKKWLYEYYHDVVNVLPSELYYKQSLDIDKTFKNWSSKEKNKLPYTSVTVHIKDRHIFAAEYYKKNTITPFLVAFYDKYGRFSEIYNDLDHDKAADQKMLYQGGRLMATFESSKSLPFDVYDYLYKGSSDEI